MADAVKHLMRLGLNEYEAKAYVATVALGEGTIKEISAESGVPRSRTYDVMEKLAEKGLVEVGSSTPICYRANEPLVASQQLMDEIRHANDEIVKELNEIGRKAEKRDNPIWTVKGDWAIDHKVDELLESTKKSVVLVFFNNRSLIKHVNVLSKNSEHKNITVLMTRQAEAFVGLLGKCRVMKMNRPSSSHPVDIDGTMTDKGFITGDGNYCIEFIAKCGDEMLVKTREGEDHRAILFNGTILSFFVHESIEMLIRSAEEVSTEDIITIQK
ncbi:TrmB family transcriptional regulator [Methanomassiliicoccus luminyensis]|uniref:TrmB family transcriptional regulator n=1 Tax=Methanomassiliicoccus luminyensis TaxID=1080712 RepID=UPI000366FC60|nr:helix-turn-helix domain-containing protein [Methanomassiliicoccus luminyensis]